MISMIVLLVIVLAAMDRARKPESWYWLTGPPSQESGSATTSPPTGQVVNIDPAVFLRVAIPDEDLVGIADDSVGLRSNESAPYHRILARARELPHSAMEALAGDADYSVLMKRPDHFRGQLLRVSGDLRRLMRYPVRENTEGIDELYEALVFTADSGTTPYRIRFTTPPVGLPTGREIRPAVPVQVIGYFFKRDQYIVEADLRVHSAPMLLSQRIDRRTDAAGPRPLSPTSESDRLRWAISLLAVVFGATILTVVWTWRTRKGDRHFAASGLKRATAAPDGAIEALADIETTAPDDFLRHLGSGNSEDSSAPSEDHLDASTDPGAEDIPGAAGQKS
tara:strand:+ start:1046 stop:2056 length:1011 start_codon:yes stop_codon:yes gene_type:complete